MSKPPYTPAEQTARLLDIFRRQGPALTRVYLTIPAAIGARLHGPALDARLSDMVAAGLLVRGSIRGTPAYTISAPSTLA